MKNEKSILLVEDDIALANGVSMALKSDTIAVRASHSIKEARKSIGESMPDLIILDINLPDGSGLDFLREIKAEKAVPIIMLTANDMETDVVVGLESGADDYITKPFSLAVLRARVNTQLRKDVTKQSAATVIDDFVFDFEKMEFSVGGNRIELSKTEQKLLRLLVENAGQTLPRETLVDRIWTYGAEYVDENALSVTVKRLRDKLEKNPPKPEYIKTVYGIGYSWTKGSEQD